MTAACDSMKMTVKNVPEKHVPAFKGPYQITIFNEMGISPVLIEGAFLQERRILINRPVMTPIGKDSCFVIKFKHSAVLRPELSVLTLFINDIYVSSVRLTEDNKDNGEIVLPVPLNLLGEPGWLITVKAFHYIGAVDCGKSYKEFAWTLIEDSSYVKFTKGFVNGYPYINYFPFIKQELSLTPKTATMWLPSNPSDNVLSTAAIIAARAGQINRVPIKWNVVFGDEFNREFSQDCIIIIGDRERITRIKNLLMNLASFHQKKNLRLINTFH